MNISNFAFRFAVTAALAALITTGYFQMASPAQAAPQGSTIIVTTTNDEFNTVGNGTGCSLREAIQAANTDAPFGGCPKGDGADTIQLDAQLYSVEITGDDDSNQAGDFDVTSDIVFQGKGSDKTFVDGKTNDRVFDLLPNSNVEFHNLDIENGQGLNQFAFGGGIRSQGTSLQLFFVSLDNNYAQWGGGIYHTGGELDMEGVNMHFNHAKTFGGAILSSGPLFMYDSTLDTNYGSSGAGLYNEDSAFIINSTFSGNRAKAFGGGIVTALENSHEPPASSLTLANVTITNNHADEFRKGSGDGGGIYIGTYTQAFASNTIIAGNFDDTGGDPSSIVNDCYGTLNTYGYNLIGDGFDCDGVTNNVNGDRVGTHNAPLDAGLVPLADNGGKTRTHALKSNSPAIDKGDATGCKIPFYNVPIVKDQRGYIRPVDGGSSDPRCDMGAFEYNSVPPSACRAVPAAPKLRKPDNGAVVHVNEVKLDWYAVPCATEYTVIVRLDSNNGNVVFKDTVTGSHDLTTSLKANHTYYWAVKACDEAGCKQSQWFSFSISR